MLCVVCSVHWVFYSVLFSTVLFCCGALPQPLFVHFINFLQLKTQVSSLCSVLGAVHALSCRRIGRSRFVQRTTYSFCLQWNIKYTEWMPARQAGRHTYTEAEGRQSQSAAAAAAAQTQALTMYLYLCIFCIGVCICVSFIRYVRSVRFVGLFALCAQSRGNSTAQRTHTIKTHTRTRTTYVCIWPGRAFIAHFIS